MSRIDQARREGMADPSTRGVLAGLLDFSPTVQRHIARGAIVVDARAPVWMRTIVKIDAGDSVYVRANRWRRYHDAEGYAELTGQGAADLAEHARGET